MPNNSHEIARLNDLCRTAMGIAGKLIQTEGICALPAADQSAIREKVETFKDFSEGNDPYGERDFGAMIRGALRQARGAQHEGGAPVIGCVQGYRQKATPDVSCSKPALLYCAGLTFRPV